MLCFVAPSEVFAELAQRCFRIRFAHRTSQTRSDVGAKEIQEMRDALHAFQAAIEAHEISTQTGINPPEAPGEVQPVEGEATRRKSEKAAEQ